MNLVAEWKDRIYAWNRRQMALHNPVSDREWREMRYVERTVRNWNRLSHRKQKKFMSRLRASIRAIDLRLMGDHLGGRFQSGPPTLAVWQAERESHHGRALVGIGVAIFAAATARAS